MSATDTKTDTKTAASEGEATDGAGLKEKRSDTEQPAQGDLALWSDNNSIEDQLDNATIYNLHEDLLVLKERLTALQESSDE
jgi:hypothetical protein